MRKTGNKVKIEKQQINLSTLHVPLSVTFALFNKKFILDPSIKEERLADGIVIVSANKFNEICYLHTYGAVKVDNETISE
jgi:exosome complex RNA-binding protein Rrp42 (RNase PH superfamily)